MDDLFSDIIWAISSTIRNPSIKEELFAELIPIFDKQKTFDETTCFNIDDSFDTVWNKWIDETS